MWLLLKVREMCLPLLFLLWLCLETHTQTIKREGWATSFCGHYLCSLHVSISEHFPVPLLLTSLTQRPARQFLSVQEEAYGKLIPSASLVLLWLMYQCGYFVFFFWLNDPMSVQSNKVHSWPFWCPSSFQRKDLSGKLVLLQADFVSDLVEFWF